MHLLMVVHICVTTRALSWGSIREGCTIGQKFCLSHSSTPHSHLSWKLPRWQTQNPVLGDHLGTDGEEIHLWASAEHPLAMEPPTQLDSTSKIQGRTRMTLPSLGRTLNRFLVLETWRHGLFLSTKKKWPLLNASWCVWRTVRANKLKRCSFGAEKVLLQGHSRTLGARAPSPKSPEGTQESTFFTFCLILIFKLNLSVIYITWQNNAIPSVIFLFLFFNFFWCTYF